MINESERAFIDFFRNTKYRAMIKLRNKSLIKQIKLILVKEIRSI